MSPRSLKRRAVRSTRPDSERFFTLMLVLSHRTFRWSVARRTVKWTLGIALGVYLVSMIGSGYGLWATKRIMSFSELQRETEAQQQQLLESQEQAQALEQQINVLQEKMNELIQTLDPKAKTPLPAAPEAGSSPPPTDGKLSSLKADLDRAQAMAKLIHARMTPIFKIWNTTPSIPPTAGYTSSPFGFRVHPFMRTNNQGDGPLSFHSGMDISNELGTPIQVTADGEVTFCGWHPEYGLHIIVRHSAEFETVYGHLARGRVVEGEKVTRGHIIGDMGASGRATGVHLHYEVRRHGRAVNPVPYLKLQKQFLLRQKPKLPFRG